MAYKLTLTDYLNKRDSKYDLATDVRKNAEDTVEKANKLLEYLEKNGISLEVNPSTGTYISSGWRPAQINAVVKGAAPKSKHISGQAIDIYDPDGDIDDFLMTHLEVLELFGFWLEHPSATKGWSHWQTIPPNSKKRIFYP